MKNNFYSKTEEEQKQIIINYLKENPNIAINNWLVSNGAPCSKNTVAKMFGKFSKGKEAAGIINNGSNVKIRLLNKREINDNGCWNWMGSLYPSGYGQISRNLKKISVHKLAYELWVGKVPEGKIICHNCNNKLCFNPKHLRADTHSSNMLDIINKKYTKPNIRPPVNQSLEERIKWYINTSNKQKECSIPVKKAKDFRGYYQIMYNKKHYYIHRLIVSFREKLNYKDKSWVARHLCSNSLCINPKHLISGTSSQNAIDNRQHHSGTKLIEENIREIRKDWKVNHKNYKYKKDFEEKWAQEYCVSRGCISNIRLNRTWKDII